MRSKKNDYINSVNLNSGTDFPYLVLDVINDESFPRNPGFRVMHWHEDLQFIYVLEGEIEVKTLDTAVRLNKGNGIFINKNVVHLVRKNSYCHYNSFIFPDHFLKFYIGSPAKVFVENIVDNSGVDFCIFSEKDRKFKSVLTLLFKLTELEKSRSEFYTYEVLCTLSQLWLEMCRHFEVPKKSYNTVTEQRMRIFLNYIEENYGGNVSLEALAKSANVSKSECLRCFKATLQTTPYKYLTEYRLSKAAELLKNTDKSISSIATEVGIEQSSHFGKLFKEKTGSSPGAYRKKKNAAE